MVDLSAKVRVRVVVILTSDDRPWYSDFKIGTRIHGIVIEKGIFFLQRRGIGRRNT